MLKKKVLHKITCAALSKLGKCQESDCSEETVGELSTHLALTFLFRILRHLPAHGPGQPRWILQRDTFAMAEHPSAHIVSFEILESRRSPLTTHFIGGQRYRMVELSYWHHRDFHRNCVFEPFHCLTFWPPHDLTGPSPVTPHNTFYAPQTWSRFSTPRLTPLTPLNPNPPAQIQHLAPVAPLTPFAPVAPVVPEAPVAPVAPVVLANPNTRLEYVGYYVGHTPPRDKTTNNTSANTRSPENASSSTTSQHGTGANSSDRGSSNTPARQPEGVREPEAGSVPEASSEGQS